jgi:hypothetical protein
MTDAQDLARRYLALWEEYLTALLADPPGLGLLWGWTGGAADDGAPAAEAGPEIGAAPAAGPSDERLRAVAEFADRLAAIEARLAALEQARPAPSRPRRGNRRLRA